VSGRTLTSSRKTTRRSKRIGLRIPVHVRGRTVEGLPFEEDTFVTQISKHGAKILTFNTVSLTEEVELENRLRQPLRARFCVVWIGPAKPDGSKELGLSYVGVPVPSVFGLYFP
jgi:hypothetical protein